MFNSVTKIMNYLFTISLRINGAKIGQNSRINYSTDILNHSQLRIGKNSDVNKNVTIYIGKKGSFIMLDNSHIAPYSYFLVDNNNITIGNDVAIGPFCSFFSHSNYYSKNEILFRKNYLDGDIKIGSNVFIGSHCVVLPNTIIEDNIIIGANSVIKGKLESGFLYAGNPVKKIKRLAGE